MDKTLKFFNNKLYIQLRQNLNKYFIHYDSGHTGTHPWNEEFNKKFGDILQDELKQKKIRVPRYRKNPIWPFRDRYRIPCGEIWNLSPKKVTQAVECIVSVFTMCRVYDFENAKFLGEDL